jgi:oligoendopeptidase F
MTQAQTFLGDPAFGDGSLHHNAAEGGSSKGIPTRQEVAASDCWDLTPLFADDAAWEKLFAEVQKEVDCAGIYRGRLAESASTLAEGMTRMGELDRRLEKLGDYAMLRSAENGADPSGQERKARYRTLATAVAEAQAFVTPEIQAVPDERMEALLADPVLDEWRLSLQKIRRYRPYTLSEGEERLLALSGEPLSGMENAFSQLTNVDFKFGELADDQGVVRPLSQSAFSSFLQARNQGVRRAAFQQFYAEFSDHAHGLASLLAHSVKADVFRAKARRYPSARAAALFHDDVAETVYDQLIASVRRRLPALHRYYALRRRALKLTEIHHYDTYVPLVQSVTSRTSYEEAVELVMASLVPLGESYGAVLRHGLLEGRWVDRYETQGKRSGAFSAGSYDGPPYILMNYKDDVFSDVFTLAHEAGHSMHTHLARTRQKFQDYGYPIFLAEVASTFNEALLTHHLLEIHRDPAMRAYVINRQIDDIRGTVFRQTMFAEFEHLIHAAQEAGEGLTLERFREIYQGLLDAYFGPDFTLDPELQLECLRIPHFYSAFYVYKYATGLSAALALSKKVLEGESGATERYLGFLSLGGKQMPLEALRAAGVDMSSSEPVEAALDVFESRVAELENLLGQIEGSVSA